MKRMIAGILVSVLSLVGCNNDVQEPGTEKRVTIDTVVGSVTIQDTYRDVEQKIMTTRIVGSGVDANLMVTATDEGDVHGVLASLTDASGQLLYSIETRVNETTGAATLIQATAQDYLSLTMSGEGDRVRETYDANGDVASFEYNQLSDEQQRHAINYWEHGMDITQLPPDVAEYARGADAFHTYYLPHENSTLADNQSGHMLMQLLNSPELPSLVIGAGQPEHVNKVVNAVCNMFNICAAYSCRIARGSVVCQYCFTMSVVCQVMMIGCMFFGC